MEQITIIVGPDGATEVSVQCVAGKKCSSVSAAIEKALGQTVQDTPTADMNKKETVNANHSR